MIEQNEVDPEMITHTYLKSIWNQVHLYNYNFLAVNTGKHRTGKSTCTTTLASVLDPTFWDELENRVVYFPNQFMDAMNDLAKKKIVGGAIIWDEAGVGIPARNWYDVSNKSIGFVTQVLGYLKPMVFFVTQDLTYIDSQQRKLLHSFYETYRNSNDYSYIKPFNINYNKRTGKIWYIYPRITPMREDVAGSTYKVKKIRIMKPPRELIKRYEDHSTIFKDKIMEQMQERVEKYGDEGIDKKQMTNKEILEHVIENYEKYAGKTSKEGDIILDFTRIKYDFEIPVNLSKFIKSDAERFLNNNNEETVKG